MRFFSFYFRSSGNTERATTRSLLPPRPSSQLYGGINALYEATENASTIDRRCSIIILFLFLSIQKFSIYQPIFTRSVSAVVVNKLCAWFTVFAFLNIQRFSIDPARPLHNVHHRRIHLQRVRVHSIHAMAVLPIQWDGKKIDATQRSVGSTWASFIMKMDLSEFRCTGTIL